MLVVPRQPIAFNETPKGIGKGENEMNPALVDQNGDATRSLLGRLFSSEKRKMKISGTRPRRDNYARAGSYAARGINAARLKRKVREIRANMRLTCNEFRLMTRDEIDNRIEGNPKGSDRKGLL